MGKNQVDLSCCEVVRSSQCSMPRHAPAFVRQPLCKEGKVSLVEYNPQALLAVREPFYFPLTEMGTWPLVQDKKSTFPNTWLHSA